MSDNYCIPFIKQENFENHVAQTIKTYNTTLKSIDLAKFNSNIIDPIKLTFDKALFRKSIDIRSEATPKGRKLVSFARKRREICLNTRVNNFLPAINSSL